MSNPEYSYPILTKRLFCEGIVPHKPRGGYDAKTLHNANRCTLAAAEPGPKYPLDGTIQNFSRYGYFLAGANPSK
jgi:hypothetical protein